MTTTITGPDLQIDTTDWTNTHGTLHRQTYATWLLQDLEEDATVTRIGTLEDAIETLPPGTYALLP